MLLVCGEAFAHRRKGWGPGDSENATAGAGFEGYQKNAGKRQEEREWAVTNNSRHPEQDEGVMAGKANTGYRDAMGVVVLMFLWVPTIRGS